MEVEVLGVNGVPQDAVISIRAGASRRQAPVSALGTNSTPFRFSGGPAGVNPFKLDILKPIGSTRLAIQKGGGTFEIPIGTDGVSVSLAVREVAAGGNVAEDLFDRLDTNKDGIITRREFNDALRSEGEKPVLQPVDGSEAIPILSPDGTRLPSLPKDSDLRFPAAANAAKEYLEKHNLLSFVRALLQTVVRESPDDPYNFIADQFRHKALFPGGKSAEGGQKASAKKVSVGDATSKLAQASLGGTMPQKMQMQADTENMSENELSQARGKAQDALIKTLTAGPEMRTKAEAALEAELARSGGAYVLQGKADNCLGSALSSDSEPREHTLKARAQKALMASLLGDQDINNSTALQQKAREALCAALVEGDEDLEKAKVRARTELLSIVVAGEGEENAKAKARNALAAALGGGLDDEDEDDLDDAKNKARNALNAVLLGGGETAKLEGAKGKAREAIISSLLGNDESDPDTSRTLARDALSAALLADETMNPEEVGKKGAQGALAAALVAQSAEGVEPGVEGDALARAEFTKLQWSVTKDKMAQQNVILKDQVAELEQNLQKLQTEFASRK